MLILCIKNNVYSKLQACFIFNEFLQILHYLSALCIVTISNSNTIPLCQK